MAFLFVFGSKQTRLLFILQLRCLSGSLLIFKKTVEFVVVLFPAQRRHLGGAGGAVAPQGKRKKEKKERKKEKREKKRKKRKRKKGTMNDVKLLQIKCCFFQFFNSPVAFKN